MFFGLGGTRKTTEVGLAKRKGELKGQLNGPKRAKLDTGACLLRPIAALVSLPVAAAAALRMPWAPTSALLPLPLYTAVRVLIGLKMLPLTACGSP